jgi:Protein of unknown function (DUF3089)
MRHPAGRIIGATALAALIAVGLIAAASAPAFHGPAKAASRTGHNATRVARTDAAGITWLCRPGIANNPCTENLDSTAVSANGSTTVTRTKPAANPAFDCFYAYPTVSQEQAVNADLKVQPAETAAAVRQASRFSTLCKVWAPMYRQTTSRTLAEGGANGAKTRSVAYNSLLAGWKDYLAHYNQGRPIIFIGHSQGSAMLMLLLSRQVDSNPKILRRMVSAILPGGNVEVPTVAGGGGTFRHIPACRWKGQTGCVIAYSTYPGQPPADSFFGRPNKGISAGLKGQAPKTSQVLCVNPAALGGGSARLDSYFPTSDLPDPGVKVKTPWVEYPSLYRATCKGLADATWMQAVRVNTRTDKRPSVTEPSTQIGFHSSDINLSLGDLLLNVQAQESTFQSANK